MVIKRHKSAILQGMDSCRNTKGIKCGSKNGTTCCPHQNVDEKGRYAATTKAHTLEYRGHKYELWTCCKMCADEMQKLAKNDVKKFDKLYVDTFFDLGKHYQNQLILKNKHTGKIVQISRQMPSKKISKTTKHQNKKLKKSVSKTRKIKK